MEKDIWPYVFGVNKLLSLATEATIFVQIFSLKETFKKFVELDVGLCPNNLPNPSVGRISNPYKRSLFKKVLANSLNFKFSLKFREKQPYLNWFICLSSSAVSGPISQPLLTPLANPFLEWVQMVLEPIMPFWATVWIQNPLISSKQLLRPLSGEEELFFI